MTITLDTSTLVRLLTLDVPERAAKVEALVRAEADAGRTAFVPSVVMGELAAVMRHALGHKRNALRPVLRDLLRTRGIAIEDHDVWEAAISVWNTETPDVVDLFLVELARRRGGALATFDRKLLKQPGTFAPWVVRAFSRGSRTMQRPRRWRPTTPPPRYAEEA